MLVWVWAGQGTHPMTYQFLTFGISALWTCILTYQPGFWHISGRLAYQPGIWHISQEFGVSTRTPSDIWHITCETMGSGAVWFCKAHRRAWSGTKTLTVKQKLMTGMDANVYSPLFLMFSAQTSALCSKKCILFFKKFEIKMQFCSREVTVYFLST